MDPITCNAINVFPLTLHVRLLFSHDMYAKLTSIFSNMYTVTLLAGKLIER